MFGIDKCKSLSGLDTAVDRAAVNNHSSLQVMFRRAHHSTSYIHQLEKWTRRTQCRQWLVERWIEHGMCNCLQNFSNQPVNLLHVNHVQPWKSHTRRKCEDSALCSRQWSLYNWPQSAITTGFLVLPWDGDIRDDTACAISTWMWFDLSLRKWVKVSHWYLQQGKCRKTR